MIIKKIYQFKITLKNSKPPIWRRIVIPSNATFYELHIAIQDSFDWADYHLHQFLIGRIYDPNAIRVMLPAPEDLFDDQDFVTKDESKTKLSELIKEVGQKINYEYDFGDSWEHLIELEKILPFDSKVAYPQVVTGKRKAPWEDSGGMWGYEEKRKIIKNAKHPMHKEITEWLEAVGYDDQNLDIFNPKIVKFRDPDTELKAYLDAVEE